MTKKSGPLAFLNKKGWHPGNIRNQEKVWKKEQEALAEKKQVEELRKQYEEARQKEEVEAMAVAAGVKKKQERLDWMYQGGMVAKQEADKRADAQMLGEKEVELKAEEEPSKADQLAQLPTFYTTDTPASANEMWQRLHGDPMFAIKQQELMARKKVVSNPVQMDAIRRSLAEKAKAKAARKAAKAEAKAAKKASKKLKKEVRMKADKRSARSSPDSDFSEEKGERSPKRPRTEQEAITQQRGAAHSEHRNRGSLSDRAHEYSRHDEAHHRHDRHSSGHAAGNGNSRHRETVREDHRYSHRHRHRDRNGDTKGREEPRQLRDLGNKEAAVPGRAARDVVVHHDAASAQGRDIDYGINLAAGTVAEDRSAHRRETERRLEEAARRKEAEEKEKAAQRYQRKEYKAGKLTEEEKAKRLAEMSGNAEVHEEARWARLQAARKRDDSEAALEAEAKEKAAAANAAPGRHHRDTAKFLSQATKDVFGAEDASLADRIGRRKYYNDRSRDEGAGAFRR